MPGPEPTDGKRAAFSFRLPLALVEQFDNEAALRTLAAQQKGHPKVSRNQMVMELMQKAAKRFK